MTKIKIGIVVGSARRESFSGQVARVLAAMLPETYEPHTLKIDQLPMFNQDYDDDGATPATWQTFRREVQEMDAFLFVTPEYNRSYPPLIKNALDIASRPYGQNAWSGKPGAVVSVSPGKMSGFGANHHLRQVLSFLNVYVMQQPEVYIGGADQLMDAQGELKDEGTRKFCQSVADAFAAWVERFL